MMNAVLASLAAAVFVCLVGMSGGFLKMLAPLVLAFLVAAIVALALFWLAGKGKD